MQTSVIYTPIGFSAEQIMGLALQLSWTEKRELALLLWKELTQKTSFQDEVLQEMATEPLWDSKSIEQNYVFDRARVIGQLPTEESAEQLISILKHRK
ncbi:MAG: hypothetical protein MUE81_22335 [Thermoflexibacter sp.]|jgi:hypothetical protein|nr:hypothetical protein [Thermoflexibacter sp.]